MKISNFEEAKLFLDTHIPETTERLFSGGIGLARTKFLLKLLGNPQDKLKVIHIAGTTGKSSTSYLLSLLLSSQGFKTGLFISPHIVDLRERIRIDNSFITKDQFIKYLNELIPFIDKVQNSEFGMPTYFEILTCLAFYYFWKEGVEYAVIETGLGGLLDGTNVVTSDGKICIITKLGLDHTEILGKTLTQVAEQKAGIITKNAIVLTTGQAKAAEKILRESAKISHAQLFVLLENINIKNIQEEKFRISFDFDFGGVLLKNIILNLAGAYQAENCSLAIAALIMIFKKNNQVIDEKKVRQTLNDVDFFGRLSIVEKNGKTIIVDGAHNQQKMEAFVSAVKHIFPGQKFNFLIAFTNTKNYKPLLKAIIPLARQIIVTSFSSHSQDLIHESVKPEMITAVLTEMKFMNWKVIVDPRLAWYELLHSGDKNDIIITGSFYLIGELEFNKR